MAHEIDGQDLSLFSSSLPDLSARKGVGRRTGGKKTDLGLPIKKVLPLKE